MYRPNFCAECGERIARDKWRWWTSRKFCAVCDKRFNRNRFVAPIVAGAFLFSTGLFAGRRWQSIYAPPPLVIERRESSAPLLSAAALQTTNTSFETANTPPVAQRPTLDSSSSIERITDPNETVSICGARTQRGTPCSRRVRGTGRCWQHRGRPAMLPASRLIVQE